ncbi:hypothetical protein FACS1894216_00920 [Synergistales bacterium]|nr:hypothetical protein FACS1894216_00920 [Synergistales bacterium]
MTKTDVAILRIQSAYDMARQMGNELMCAYSGGKDSDVLLDLTIKSGVPFRAEHNHTTADAPQTVYHIREVFNELNVPCAVNMPNTSMWELIVKNGMPPTRITRYCCKELKERKFENQHLLFGIRWAESNSRKKRGLHETISAKVANRMIYADENDDARKLTEICYAKNRVATNPIIDWTDTDIWDYIRRNRLKMNPLYEMCFNRVGCIGCPMARKNAQMRGFAIFPQYKKMYLSAFERMLNGIREKGLSVDKEWETPKAVFNWWINGKSYGQQFLFEEGQEKGDRKDA